MSTCEYCGKESGCHCAQSVAKLDAAVPTRLAHWRLDARGEPVRCSFGEWAMWFEHSPNRVLKQEWVDNVSVSTVFLGLDHNFAGEGLAWLWETMTFSNRKRWDTFCDRCGGGREHAEAMHAAMVERVRAELAKAKP